MNSNQNMIKSIKDYENIHICHENGRNFIVSIGQKSKELFDTLITIFNGELNRPYVIKSAQLQKPLFGIMLLNDPYFNSMEDEHKAFFKLLIDHYTGIQLFYTSTIPTDIDYPVNIYIHSIDNILRIHCNDFITEIEFDIDSIVKEIIESYTNSH